jgi:hypothetical protein
MDTCSKQNIYKTIGLSKFELFNLFSGSNECLKAFQTVDQRTEKRNPDQQNTLKESKKNDEFYLKADKSNSVVAVDRTDY